MSKILFIVNHDVVIYNFRLELVEELIFAGHEVYISSPYGERIDNLVKIGCKYKKTEFLRHSKNPFREIILLNEYYKLIKEINPNIVLTYTIKPNIYGGIACSKLNMPFIVNITGLGTAVENGGIIQKYSITI